MKYLPLRDLESVTSALNFNTADCHVVGGCDLYTTKAAGSDKKLYKNIASSLESQHESLIRLSTSLSPPQAKTFAETFNLSRSSPFGPLSQVSSRRIFAYLIATLNASHPDYDFSQILRPSDFHKERSLRSIINTMDETLYNLRPRPAGTYLASTTANAASVPAGTQTPGGSQTWGPRMWKLVDKEMSLKQCNIYRYAPEEDPFDGEESSIWSLHYLFFNKERKRVCYIHVRGLSIISHSPVRTPWSHKRHASQTLSADMGAKKRARHWLGEKAAIRVEDGWEGDGCEDFIDDPGDDEVDVDESFLDLGGFSDSEDNEEIELHYQEKGTVRGVSETVMDSVEV